jgi:nitric oxide dioxygenase
VLSEKSAETIRVTLPAVGAAIGEITAVFYDSLFAAHPELLRDLFNRGNQANGTQRDALAGAIAAFATALVTGPDGQPEVMLSRIAHKHASLGVTRDQYQVVHTHLFAAIAEVLGDAVTDDVAAAWDEVYWLLADTLAETETRLYREAGVSDGNTWRDYRVIGRHTETHEVVTFLVSPLDGAPAPTFQPGQYVSVQVQLPDGAHQIRQYSLSGTPVDALQFTVKRLTGAPDGEVSNYLHDIITEGDTFRVSAPFGDVTLDHHDNPVLLASAGIGCTPMIGMLRHLARNGSSRQIIAVHADRTPTTHAFRADLDLLVAKLPHAEAHVWYEAPHAPWPADRTGRSDLTTMTIPADTTAYLCGPRPFMDTSRAQLLTLGIPPTRIHYELFGPDDLDHPEEVRPQPAV